MLSVVCNGPVALISTRLRIGFACDELNRDIVTAGPSKMNVAQATRQEKLRSIDVDAQIDEAKRTHAKMNRTCGSCSP